MVKPITVFNTVVIIALYLLVKSNQDPQVKHPSVPEVAAISMPLVEKSVKVTPTPQVTISVIPTATAIPVKAKTLAPREQPVKYSKAEIEKMIRSKFGVNAETAIKIAYCESGLDPSRVGDKSIYPHSYGLFQVRGLKGRGTVSQLLTPQHNIDQAFQISGGGKVFSKAWVTCAKKVGAS